MKNENNGRLQQCGGEEITGNGLLPPIGVMKHHGEVTHKCGHVANFEYEKDEELERTKKFFKDLPCSFCLDPIGFIKAVEDRIKETETPSEGGGLK